ncbi:hypothetical protein LZ32DRAFT_139989 [Colletotrichum eremochloae]|nr:hypothetical protein LZ32DRAFT_139989 [Colletotrichum eremochloae]
MLPFFTGLSSLRASTAHPPLFPRDPPRDGTLSIYKAHRNARQVLDGRACPTCSLERIQMPKRHRVMDTRAGSYRPCHLAPAPEIPESGGVVSELFRRNRECDQGRNIGGRFWPAPYNVIEMEDCEVAKSEVAPIQHSLQINLSIAAETWLPTHTKSPVHPVRLAELGLHHAYSPVCFPTVLLVILHGLARPRPRAHGANRARRAFTF